MQVSCRNSRLPNPIIFAPMSWYRWLIKPLLFRFDPERVHHFVFGLLKRAMKIPGVRAVVRSTHRLDAPELKRTVAGLEFPNPVGLAAGFDKDALLYRELADLGFGFVEIGTVTPRPQPGNPRPRLFRLPADEALINRMGFNNAGAEAAARRLGDRRPGLLIGGNIGKNKDTPNEQAVQDYLLCLDTLYAVVDYFVVNVSSPNTPGLRALQEKEPLLAILRQLMERSRTLAKGMTPRPVFLKIAPDLTPEQLDDIVSVVLEAGLAGIIATNTTLYRNGLHTDPTTIESIGAGGLSGKPLREKSTRVIRYLAERSGGRFAIIGAGGIHSPEDALEKLGAGADLVQLYTGFIYEGPGLVKRILRRLLA
jgi:dihydroorotate dehydrogenase